MYVGSYYKLFFHNVKLIIDFQLLYVMELSVDLKSSSKNNIKIVSITEISLLSPILNMIIVNTKVDHNDVNCMENSSHSK